MAVNAVSQATDTSVCQHYTPAPTTVFMTDGLAVAAVPVTAKMDASAPPAESETLSSVIAELGSRNKEAQQTYNAFGRLNFSLPAGHASISKLRTATPAYHEDLTDCLAVSKEPGSAFDSKSRVYTATGDLQNLPMYAADVRNAGGIVNTYA